ncbi:MAG: GAF domain-containing protein, partial [Actinobacteria bacterium]|nr:GAF domain-containing protein [Actinomycetota bacterium]
IAQAPEHSSNPQELAACADASMLTAKGAGKNRITVFDGDLARTEKGSPDRGVRTIAHLKMLQSLSNRLNRLNELPQIGNAILGELMTLLDYHACRVYVAEGEWLTPIAHRHEFSSASGEAVMPPPQRVGEGIAGRAAATRVSLLIDNSLQCEFAQQLPGTDDVAESVIATPLLFGDEVMGVVVVTKLGIDAFDADDARLIEVLAGQASVALKNAALYAAERTEAERARHLLERSNEFLRLSHELVEVRDVEEVARRATETVTKLLRCDSSSLWLQAEAGAGLTSVGGCGPAFDGHSEGANPSYPNVEPARLRTERSPFLIGADESKVETGTRQQLVAPLRFGGDRVGALVAGGAEFTPEDARIIEGIADQTRMALTNAEQFSSLETMFVSTVESLANALEANDEYTSTHARAITDMALEVGERVGLVGDELKRLEVGALFHDIGKIGIPKEILSKPSALTKDERQVVERHPVIGERILAPIRQLDGIGEIVRHCHERYDGGGYPDGLRERAIPFAARIIFVCDAYHAMTSERPYSEARSHEDALAELRGGAGSQFDPVVVAAFVSLFGAGSG